MVDEIDIMVDILDAEQIAAYVLAERPRLAPARLRAGGKEAENLIHRSGAPFFVTVIDIGL